jgi:hypothetical protein
MSTMETSRWNREERSTGRERPTTRRRMETRFPGLPMM